MGVLWEAGFMLDVLESYGIKIQNTNLLNIALTHTSYSNEHNFPNYERLEFLGDAVLELVTSEYFYLNTNYDEGAMSKIRASYVCEEALDAYAEQINLKKYIRVGKGQENNINKTIVADVFESVLAVIYLEKGLEVVKDFIYKIIIPNIEKNIHYIFDYKSILQEMVQTNKNSLEYVVVSETGPAHDKTFTVEVRIDDIVYGKGEGKSKKEAEQKAAEDAYKKRCTK